MDEPDLKGRVTLRISVSATGAVSSSTIESSTLGNGRVESCIADAVQGWRFPAPLGGKTAVISYPFNLH
jgi:TonB family protein